MHHPHINIGWDSCPDGTSEQVRRLLAGFQARLGSNFTGVYLHGSLAMGCFNPATSDVDLLILTWDKISLSTRKSLIELLLPISGSPHPVEVSLLHLGDLVPWQYPTPFEMHYGEERRKSYSEDLATGNWRQWDKQPQTDPDLAAHIAVTKQRGICLCGEPIESVFPKVPHKDYLASIVSDLEWAQERLGQNVVYGVLNTCRVYAYLQEKRVCTKDEAAAWALYALPSEFHAMIGIALDTYRGQHSETAAIDDKKARRLMEYVVAIAKAALMSAEGAGSPSASGETTSW